MAKLLLVEDNEMNRDMLSRRLERSGYQVIMAVDLDLAHSLEKIETQLKGRAGVNPAG